MKDIFLEYIFAVRGCYESVFGQIAGVFHLTKNSQPKGFYPWLSKNAQKSIVAKNL